MPRSSSVSPLHPLAIIGDGYAAAVLVYHLARQGFDLGKVALVGRGKPGQGAAYGTRHPDFRLNVRDDLMVIDQNNPLDFPRWAAKHISDAKALDKTGGGKFYRRCDFARYLAERINPLEARITRIRAFAERLKPAGYGWQIALDDGRSIKAGAVVLATGNPPPETRNLIADTAPPERIISRPWEGERISNLDKDAPVLLVGGGLTAMDACLALHNRRHRGTITLVSPHGLLPPRQVAWESGDIPPWPTPLTARGFLRHIRCQLPDASWESEAWQSAFESVRIMLNDGWMRLDEAGREKLMRRVGWVWNLARYRAAPQTVDAVKALRDSGRFRIVIGRVRHIGPNRPDRDNKGDNNGQSNALAVSLADGKVLLCAYAVVASGPGHDRLLDRLISDRLATKTAAGIAVDHDFKVISPHQASPGKIWAIGTPCRFSLGDVVGATTIAKHAARLAAIISETDAHNLANPVNLKPAKP